MLPLTICFKPCLTDFDISHGSMASRKSVLITGCSKGGIGDVLAQQLHQKGLLVFATARSLAKIEHLKELGIRVLSLDVVDDATIQKAVDQVGAVTGGKLDYLINNSGGGQDQPLDTSGGLTCPTNIPF